MLKSDTAHTRIKSIRCYNQLIAYRQSGANNAMCARFIEDEGEAWWSTDARTGEQAVRRFFLDNPELGVTNDPELAMSIEKKWDGQPPPYITKLRDQVESSLDALAEMERLYGMQLRRIQVLFDKEREDEKARVGTALRAEMTLGMRMLNDIARLQMDTEVLKRAPAKYQIAEYHQLDVSRELFTLLTNPKFREAVPMPVLREIFADSPQMQKLLEAPPEGVKERIRRGLIED